MRVMTCSKCVFVYMFIPNENEIALGRTLGCGKPGWEGYTNNDNPACGGAFFMPGSKKEVKE